MSLNTKIILFFLIILSLSLNINQPIWSLPRDLDSETNGFFAGISQNYFDFKGNTTAQGLGWQAGIIQKTEKRPYGYLTGLLYFDYIKAHGHIPTLGNSEIIMNDIVFSLWISQIFLKNNMVAPVISLGPAFIFKIKSSISPDTEDITNSEKLEYNEVIFDLKAQLSLGAYIRINKGLYLYPQIIGNYNLLNNNKLSELWGLKSEYNLNFSIGLLYSVTR